LFVFWDSILLCSTDWPWTFSSLPSAFWVLELQVQTTVPGLIRHFAKLKRVLYFFMSWSVTLSRYTLLFNWVVGIERWTRASSLLVHRVYSSKQNIVFIVVILDCVSHGFLLRSI
jgi:hypothetical protein